LKDRIAEAFRKVGEKKTEQRLKSLAPFYFFDSFLSKFIRHAIAAFGVDPINVVGWTCNSAGTTLDAVLKSNGCDFEFLFPLIHVGRTEIITILCNAI
jgi:hypothetical protein